MALFRWIRSRRDGKLVAAHVETLLARTADSIREATLHRAAGLPRAEARGYIRAKATTILAAAIDSLVGRQPEPIPDRLQPLVLQAAAERMTAAVLEQAGRTRVGLPLRRAA